MKILLRTDVLANNNIAAEYNRNLLDASHTLVLNLMSSPGAGKTSILEETNRHLSKQY